MWISAGCFPKLDLEEILLKLLNCEHTSGMRLKLYPEASLLLSCLNTCQKSTILLQDLFSCLEGRWNCQRIIEWLKLEVTLKFAYFQSPAMEIQSRRQECTVPVLTPIIRIATSCPAQGSVGQCFSGSGYSHNKQIHQGRWGSPGKRSREGNPTFTTEWPQKKYLPSSQFSESGAP